MSKRDEILEALSGKTKCQAHDEWLDEGEKCGRCLIEHAPANLLKTLGDMALEGKKPDTQELVTNLVATVLHLNHGSGRGLLGSLLPEVRAARPRQRRPKKRTRRVRNRLLRHR